MFQGARSVDERAQPADVLDLARSVQDPGFRLFEQPLKLASEERVATARLCKGGAREGLPLREGAGYEQRGVIQRLRFYPQPERGAGALAELSVKPGVFGGLLHRGLKLISKLRGAEPQFVQDRLGVGGLGVGRGQHPAHARGAEAPKTTAATEGPACDEESDPAGQQDERGKNRREDASHD